jgi:hypothetical protein
VVAPLPSDTLMVHVMALLTRCGLFTLHARFDAVVGLPYTRNVGAPFVMTLLPTLTVTANAALLLPGVVANVNVDPPLTAVGVIDDVALDEIVKSSATPVVAPPAPSTLMVHSTGDPARCGLFTLHARLDDAVGVPYTVYVSDPPEISVDPVTTLIWKPVVTALGVVLNVNVAPPSLLESALLLAVAVTVKSDDTPVVTPEALRTVMVHWMALPVRGGLPAVHARLDDELGVP